MDTPLSPGESEIFRNKRLQVVAGITGDLIVNLEASENTKIFRNAIDEVFILDGEIRMISLGGLIIYQEGGENPIFINNGLVHSPQPMPYIV